MDELYSNLILVSMGTSSFSLRFVASTPTHGLTNYSLILLQPRMILLYIRKENRI